MTTKTISQLEQVASITANDQVIVRDPEETTFAKTKYATVTQLSTFIVAAASEAGLQPNDGDLTAISALTGAGLAARTNTDVWALRTLQPPAAGLTITNPAGTAGDPTFVLADDLEAVEGLSTTGIVRRTGSDTWSAGTTVATTEIADDAVTDAKLRESGALSVIGRSANSTGNPADIATTSGTDAVLRENAGVVGFGTIATAGIANNAVSDTKIRDSGALSVIGRSANSSGDPADISATAASDAVLRESGSVLGFGTIATGGIANNAITDTKLRDSGALSVIGRSANSAGDPADISAVAASGSVLRESGSTVGFGTIATAGIADDAVTFDKTQNIATSRILGRTTASSGNIEELTGSQAGGLIALDDLSNVDAPTPADGEVLTWDDANGEWIALAAPGAGSGAPSDAQYITLATHASLSAERTLAAGSAIKLTDAGANGNATLDLDITELTEDTTPAVADDLIVTYDDSATANKKVKLTNIPINASKISTGTLPDARLSSAATAYGKQSVWIPASAMAARTTNGAAAGSVEMTTNKNMFKTLDFDTSTQEFAQFSIAMPASWDEGTVTFQPVWSHPSTVTNFGVVLSLAGVALSNDDAGDVAFGTAQTSTDTGGTTNDIYLGPESSAITIAGTPAANDLVMFQIARVPSDGSDTLGVDARLHGILLHITTDAGHD